MNTAPDVTMPTAIAATEAPKAAALPRIKLMPHGFSIDHPDPELGDQLMADALGVADREAMHGIVRQLVRASVNGESPDEVTLSFMLSMVRSIRPRDSLEAMLVAQMISVHVMAMRCAHHLADADDLARHDSAARALGRLARTFPAQIEALNRHRSRGEPAITVQNVSVTDGGKAIVGNVTQHARVIVSERGAAAAARKPARAGAPGGGVLPPMPSWKPSDKRSYQNDRPDAGERSLWRQNPLRRCVSLAGGARENALPHAWRRQGIRGAEGQPERAQARPVHGGCDRRATAGSGGIGRSAEAVGGDEVSGVRNLTRHPRRSQLAALLRPHWQPAL